MSEVLSPKPVKKGLELEMLPAPGLMWTDGVSLYSNVSSIRIKVSDISQVLGGSGWLGVKAQALLKHQNLSSTQMLITATTLKLQDISAALQRKGKMDDG